MEVLINFYQELPTAIHWLFNFLFTVVFLRGIVANKLLAEGKKYYQNIKTQWHSDRNQAIREHYILQKAGRSHTADSVLDCSDGDCLLFKTAPGSPVGLVQSTSQ